MSLKYSEALWMWRVYQCPMLSFMKIRVVGPRNLNLYPPKLDPNRQTFNVPNHTIIAWNNFDCAMFLLYSVDKGHWICFHWIKKCVFSAWPRWWNTREGWNSKQQVFMRGKGFKSYERIHELGMIEGNMRSALSLRQTPYAFQPKLGTKIIIIMMFGCDLWRIFEYRPNDCIQVEKRYSTHLQKGQFRAHSCILATRCY